MESKNVITHIQDNEAKKKVLDVFDELNLLDLSIDDYEEFFHALIHIKPYLFMVEINSLEDPYIKVIQIIKKSVLTRSTPIVVLSKAKDEALYQELSKLDLMGIIQAPFHKGVMHIEIRNALNMLKKQRLLDNTQDLQAVQSVMISSLASLTEYRDPETGEHIKRTQNYVKALAITLKRQGFFVDELTPENIEAIYMSVPLHDIGKIGIRDEILLKPGRLTEEEYEEMKRHTTLGYEAINKVGSKLKNNDFLNYAAEVAYTHHERYDGTGYPRGLKGEEIPLVGRLMAVADVYDALVSERIYKVAMTHDEAMDIIITERGTHFDPCIVDCAVGLERTFRNIAQTYSDTEPDDNRHHLLERIHRQGHLNRILIVEDSRIVRRVMENQFLSLGINVDVAIDGREGLDKIVHNSYDLVLLDIELPKLNGYEMVEAVKKRQELPVIIAMTATDYSVTLHEIKAMGIAGLILKPVDLERLGTKYAEILRKTKSRQLLNEDGR